MRAKSLAAAVLGVVFSLGAMGGDGISISLKDVGWRCNFAWQGEVVKWPDGALSGIVYSRREKRHKPSGKMPEVVGAPPAEWKSPDFDDTEWAFSSGPIVHAGFRKDLAVMYLRGRLWVKDPSALKKVSLSVGYIGGLVVYLNGKDVGRGHMPKGDIEAGTPAEVYPKDVYVDENGKLLLYSKEIARKRTRTLTMDLPVSLLRKGENILALEIHRAPTLSVFYTAKRPRSWRRRGGQWTHVALKSFSMDVSPAGSMSTTVGKMQQVAVWPGNPLVEVFSGDAGELRGDDWKLKVAAARNGGFDAVVCVTAAGKLRSLEVVPGDFKGKGGVIPSKNVLVRFGVWGGLPPANSKHRHVGDYLGVLACKPVLPLAPPRGVDRVTLPIWLTVRVPKDVAPGKYEGNVSIKVNGAVKTVPVDLFVSPYTLPDPRNFSSFVGLIESPESVALKYEVNLWSEEHWKLLDEVFSLLGRVGVKSVFIHLCAHTNQGNAYSMVRWIRQSDGSWKHDFSVVDRYVGIVKKHLGKIPVVGLIAWTPMHGFGSWGKLAAASKNARPPLFTVWDPNTGEMKNEKGPMWGSQGSVEFWKPVFDGVLGVLEKHGLKGSAALGVACDFNPTKQAYEDLKAASGGLRWVMHSHGYTLQFAGEPLKLNASVWGIHGPFVSTEDGTAAVRRYGRIGWKMKRYKGNPVFTTIFPRYGAGSMGHVHTKSPLGVYHALVEAYLASGKQGVSRLGADFWPVVKLRRGMGSVIVRFPTKDRPGPPDKANPALLYPLKDGPAATVRFEVMRLGVQEAEARIHIEKKTDCKPPKDVQKMLDERILAVRRAKRSSSVMYSTGTDASWLWYAGGHHRRALRLFSAAGKI